MGVAEFFLSACTDAAFIPVLFQVAQRRRHFELFVGILQLTSTFMYNCSSALGTSLFIHGIQWHFISDVLTLTYVCCLLVHCAGGHDENINICLRYISFTCAWIFKYRDSWDSAVWETLLISIYVAMAIYGYVSQDVNRKKQYDSGSLQIGGGIMVFGGVFLLLDFANLKDSFGLLDGCMHVAGAGAAFFMWKAVPTFDSKKNDDLPSRISTSTMFV